MNRSRRSFTLIEVLIALALIIALFGAMFGFHYDLLNVRSRTSRAVERQRAADLLIDRIEADLAVCIAADSQYGVGVRGDEASLTMLVRTVNAHLAEQGAGSAAAFNDLQLVGYRYLPATKTIEIARSAMENGRRLTSKEYASITEDIAHVQLRYHDGGDWSDSFDSVQSGGLPLAVEIAIWFDPIPGEEIEEDDDELLFERETFDASAGFDESEFADRSERLIDDRPLPDRHRVIAVADAAASEDSGDDAP